jgi:AAA+ superfamily predicted ATPase
MNNNLAVALKYLGAHIRWRLGKQPGLGNGPEVAEHRPSMPSFDLAEKTVFTRFLRQTKISDLELIYLIIALAPHLQPGFFDAIIRDCLPDAGDFPEFGGVRSGNCRGLLPTGETALFILAGNEVESRLAIYELFSPDHWFVQQKLLVLEEVRQGEPRLSGRLVLDPEVVELFVTGAVSRPHFSIEFPAEHLDTSLDWDDLVLNPDTRRQIRDIEHWIEHKDTLLRDWGMGRKMKPGFRALFYGPPGTGKTMTATLLGKQTGRDVFRIDLSRVVSKFIGETEKNLARLFDKAEHKEWILFFDEADALFGKRTDIRDAHDKYANQEVAYLLQRIESYDGLVILATNQRANIDDAFVRRFQSIIHFPMPGVAEREIIWRKTLPPQIVLAPGLQWSQVASGHELSGASILNICHYCALQALASGSACLDAAALEAGIMREYVKEGRVV